ncbi:MAG: trypsin-like peptidase domain-containing protein, partial [Bdellovibrionales bacterium]|nr:S1C family serine protease [Bdellovibrionales bacterium]NQZ19738.1 trypsin-like peptidase domain-containing protein [Bdellovibrionales bacterium]
MKSLVLSLLLIFSSSAWADPMDGAPLEAPLPRNLWVEMSKRIQPGVVGIYVELDQKSREKFRDPFFDFIEEFLGPGVEFETPEGESQESPIGTGFVVGNEGIIVTNYHVVQPADSQRYKASLKVKVQGQEKLIAAELVGKDPRGDLAVLKLKEKVKLKALEFGDSDKLQVGEYVAAFGNPYGHSNSMTVG